MSPNVKTLKYCKVSEVVFIHRTTPEWGGIRPVVFGDDTGVEQVAIHFISPTRG
jgi:hypothetical protein